MRELKVKDTAWISLVRPTQEDIEELRKRFPQIHPLVLEELLTPTIRPRVENYDHHLYMVLHFPKFVPGPEKSISDEIDFILLPDTLITVQYTEIAITKDLWHACEDRRQATERYGKTPVHLLYYLLRAVYTGALRELDKIQEEIDSIEAKVFSGREKDILEDVSILKRDILDFRRAFKPQHLTIKSLVTQGVAIYGEKVKPFLIDLVGEYSKVWNLLETHKETLDALFDTTNSLLTTRINEVMRAFTVLAFISFIPTAIANIYGMNLENIPLSERPEAFWAVILLMLFVTGLVYAALKWRKLV